MKTIETAQLLWSEGKEVEAISLLRDVLSRGSEEVFSSLGFYLCHFHEEGKFPYLVEGRAMLAHACANGDGCACHNLGSLWLGGQPSLGNDPKIAASYYIRAKDLGFVVADESFYCRWQSILNG